jgi:hypothetical protein
VNNKKMASYVEIARQFLANKAQAGASQGDVDVEPAAGCVEALPELVPTNLVNVPETKSSGSGSDSGALSLKGHAIEVWCDHAGGRVFIVADEADALEAMMRFGAHRGEIWIPAEIELVGRIEDQAIRDEVADFKRQIDGWLSPGDSGEAVSPEERKASMLNELFRTQGVTGHPGRITAATVRDGERKAREKDL